MTYIIALTIILFRIAIPFIFGYAYYWAKPGRSKIIVLSSFIFYWLSNTTIVLFFLFDHQLSRAFSSHSSITPFLFGNTEDIDGAFIIGLVTTVITVNMLHFIYALVYTVIFGILWAKFLRLKKEDEYEVVYTGNSQMEDSSKVESPENSQEENTHEKVSTDTIEDSQNNDLPPDNNKEKLYAILKELFKK